MMPSAFRNSHDVCQYSTLAKNAPTSSQRRTDEKELHDIEWSIFLSAAYGRADLLTQLLTCGKVTGISVL